MKVEFKKDGNVLDFAIDEEITEREKEFKGKYDNCNVKSISFDFNEGVIVEDIHDIDEIKPSMVEKITVTLI